MSDTPRTDAKLIYTDEPDGLCDFARQLERELAAAQAGIECAQQVEQVLRQRIAELERQLEDASQWRTYYGPMERT